ncbi:MAG: UvrD-helicase domain-containing protein [Prevotella sp.]|nr:UvrD-helicase domain-containing protein [Prevotella sp.]
MTEDTLLEQLNEGQRAAVEYCDGASLVIAGAGSGKTRVLTYKIAYLLKKGMLPWNILALTFTNKAAREMKERIGKLVGVDDARRLNMGTFHSVFSRILRAEAENISYTGNFTIYDQSDSRSMIKAIIKEMGLDEKTYKASAVADRISMLKNKLLLPAAYAANALEVAADRNRKIPAFKDIYMRYVGRCRQANVMDFDDLLVNTYILFDTNEDVRKKYVDRFLYVLVDEYQDTNYAQQAIVAQLTRDRRHICVVGDDAQSIYGFRGANIDNILNFTSLYDGAKLFKLEQNYRSTQMIVEAANSLIKKNSRQIPKTVFSENAQGERLVFKQAYSDKEEAIIVCNDIRRIKTLTQCDYKNFAILYRTNAQSRSFEESMRKMNIPYRIYGGLSFYQRKEIKDIVAYFRVVVNPDDEEAVRRIINYPARGIGDATIKRIRDKANEAGVSMWRVICEPEVYPAGLSAGTLKKLAGFHALICGWMERVTTDDAYHLGHDIIQASGIAKEVYGGHEPEDRSRQENIDEFLSGMQDFVDSRTEEGMMEYISLGDFLQEIALLTDLDSDDDDTDDKVSLMTIHSAKGLEFSNVFIVGLEENIFPSPACCDNPRELEEERRLLYVAVTRAEKRCIMTCAKSRFRYGHMEFSSPSRFIRDFAPGLIRVESGGYSADEQSSAPQYHRRTESAPNKVQRQIQPVSTPVSPRLKPIAAVATVAAKPFGQVGEGSVIEHQRFGVGRVIKIEGTGENTKATVEFKNAGTKQLLLKFARYNIIG